MNVASNPKPSVNDWRAAGSVCQYQNLDIYCRHPQQAASSDRTNLLLIHGFPTASWDWHLLWPTLQQQFELTAIDMLGFGFSAKPKKLRYSIAQQADIHEFIAQQRGIQNTHLLVHDYGVSVAQELLARQRDKKLSFQIESCLFLNGGLFHGVHKPLPIQHVLASPLGFVLIPFLGKSALRRSMQTILAPDFQPTQWDIEQMWSLIQHNQGNHVMHKISRYMHERKQFYQRWLHALTDTTIPLRLVVGSLDPISGAHLAAAYQELIPKADVVELTDTGHYPQLENPSAVLDACQYFWQKVIQQ